MPNIRIKEYQNGVYATGKFVVLDDPRHNALFPGEVVEVSEDWVKTFDALFRRNMIELTIDAPTRPLLYRDPVEARLFDPRHKHKGESTIRAEAEQIKMILSQHQEQRKVLDKERSRADADELAEADAQAEREEQVTMRATRRESTKSTPSKPAYPPRRKGFL